MGIASKDRDPKLNWIRHQAMARMSEASLQGFRRLRGERPGRRHYEQRAAKEPGLIDLYGMVGGRKRRPIKTSSERYELMKKGANTIRVGPLRYAKPFCASSST
jgi:hypothetical protein